MGKKVVGIDIGSTTIRGVELVSQRGKPVIKKIAEVPLPSDVIVGGELREPAVLVSALKLLWKTGKFTTKNVAIGVGNQQTLVRQIDVTLDMGEDFKDLLPYKISEDLPVDASELTIDYYPLGDYVDNKGNIRRKALIVGALNSTMENYVETLIEAGYKPLSADFTGFSLIRTAMYTAGNPKIVASVPEPGEEYPCEVLVDVGSNVTIVTIHYMGRPLFVRIAQGGGNSVTRALADHLQIRWESAEALKREIGVSKISQPDPRLAKYTQDLTEEQRQVAEKIINMMSSSLVQIVRESVEYFLVASPQIVGVSRVLLSGSGSLLPGYGERLASELRTDVGFLAPIRKFSKKNQKEKNSALDPKFSIAFGLCIGVDRK